MSIRVSITITATAPVGMTAEDARRTAGDLLRAAGFTIQDPGPRDWRDRVASRSAAKTR